MLSHFTNSLESLISIIINGLIFFPNETKIFSTLTSGGCLIGEPQCRGMISFTDIPFEHSESHRKLYGNFGVVIERKWAVSEGACKVIYVGKEGPVSDHFRSLFTILEPKFESTGNTDLDQWVGKLARTKPEFSKSLGNEPYAQLLKIHEYMQSDEEVAESEWRIIRSHKFSWSEGMAIEEVKALCLRSALAGIIPTLTLKPESTKGIICPSQLKTNLLSALPSLWQEVQILEY